MKETNIFKSRRKKKGLNRPYLHPGICLGKSSVNISNKLATNCKTCLSRSGKVKNQNKIYNKNISKKKNNNPEVNINDYNEYQKYNIFKQRSKKMQPIKINSKLKKFFPNTDINTTKKSYNQKPLFFGKNNKSYENLDRKNLSEIYKFKRTSISNKIVFTDIEIPKKKYKNSDLINKDEIKNAKNNRRYLKYLNSKLKKKNNTKQRNKNRNIKYNF